MCTLLNCFTYVLNRALLQSRRRNSISLMAQQAIKWQDSSPRKVFPGISGLFWSRQPDKLETYQPSVRKNVSSEKERRRLTDDFLSEEVLSFYWKCLVCLSGWSAFPHLWQGQSFFFLFAALLVHINHKYRYWEVTINLNITSYHHMDTNTKYMISTNVISSGFQNIWTFMWIPQNL